MINQIQNYVFDCRGGTCKKYRTKWKKKVLVPKALSDLTDIIPKPEKPKIVKPVQAVKQKLCLEFGASVTSLKIHMNRHHSEPQTCPHCGKVFNSLSSIRINLVKKVRK